MELLILLGLAALLWIGLRSKGAPAPKDAADVAVEGVRVGLGCPLSLMVVMAVIVLVIMVGSLATGNCDPNAVSGASGNCMDTAFTTFENAAGLQHHDSMSDWWADPANPFR